MLQAEVANAVGCGQRNDATAVVGKVVVAAAVVAADVVVVIVDDVHQTQVGLKLIVGVRLLLHADRFSQIRIRISSRQWNRNRNRSRALLIFGAAMAPITTLCEWCWWRCWWWCCLGECRRLLSTVL